MAITEPTKIKVSPNTFKSISEWVKYNYLSFEVMNNYGIKMQKQIDNAVYVYIDEFRKAYGDDKWIILFNRQSPGWRYKFIAIRWNSTINDLEFGWPSNDDIEKMDTISRGFSKYTDSRGEYYLTTAFGVYLNKLYNIVGIYIPALWPIEDLPTLPDGTTKTLTLGSAQLALLTDEDKKIATDKGWTLT